MVALSHMDRDVVAGLELRMKGCSGLLGYVGWSVVAVAFGSGCIRGRDE